jgi:hypothetical protein
VIHRECFAIAAASRLDPAKGYRDAAPRGHIHIARPGFPRSRLRRERAVSAHVAPLLAPPGILSRQHKYLQTKFLTVVIGFPRLLNVA